MPCVVNESRRENNQKRSPISRVSSCRSGRWGWETSDMTWSSYTRFTEVVHILVALVARPPEHPQRHTALTSRDVKQQGSRSRMARAIGHPRPPAVDTSNERAKYARWTRRHAKRKGSGDPTTSGRRGQMPAIQQLLWPLTCVSWTPSQAPTRKWGPASQAPRSSHRQASRRSRSTHSAPQTARRSPS